MLEEKGTWKKDKCKFLSPNVSDRDIQSLFIPYSNLHLDVRRIKHIYRV